MAYDFGLRLARCRKKKHLSQEAVAKKLEVDRSTVSGYENNTITPSLQKLSSLAVIYDVSIDYLLNRYPNAEVQEMEDRHMEQTEILNEMQKNLSVIQQQVKDLKNIIDK